MKPEENLNSIWNPCKVSRRAWFRVLLGALTGTALGGLQSDTTKRRKVRFFGSSARPLGCIEPGLSLEEFDRVLDQLYSTESNPDGFPPNFTERFLSCGVRTTGEARAIQQPFSVSPPTPATPSTSLPPTPTNPCATDSPLAASPGSGPGRCPRGSNPSSRAGVSNRRK